MTKATGSIRSGGAVSRGEVRARPGPECRKAGGMGVGKGVVASNNGAPQKREQCRGHSQRDEGQGVAIPGGQVADRKGDPVQHS